MHNEDDRLLRRAEVERMLGLSRSGLDALVHECALPAPIRIGARALRWRLSDIQGWVADRPSVPPTRAGGGGRE